MQAFCGGVVGMVGSSVTGAIAVDRNYQPVMVLAALGSLIGALAAAMLIRTPRPPALPRSRTPVAV